MRERVSRRRPGKAHLATALLRRKIESWAFPVIDQLIEELTDTHGTPPASPLFDARVVRSTLRHSRHVMMCSEDGGLALARLATLLVPHLPSRTAHEAKRALFLEADAFRLYASALFRKKRIFDAKEAADRSRYLFKIPLLRKIAGRYLEILNLTAGQIAFELGDTDLGLAIVARAADRLHVTYGDELRFLKGRQIYGTLLMKLQRWAEAAEAFDEILEIAEETGNPELRTALTQCVALCGKRLGEEHADSCHASAMKLVKATGIGNDVARSEWMLIIDLQNNGKISEAISEMYKLRQSYIDAGNELRAESAVTPTIVETLVSEGRLTEARKLGEIALLPLAEAGLKIAETRIRNALKVAPPLGGATMKH
jgi:tetratricopeptide (TPR) repeat protein